MLILSTAATLARDRPVRLLTLDNDFITFAEEIAGLGVKVVSGYDLPSDPA